MQAPVRRLQPALLKLWLRSPLSVPWTERGLAHVCGASITAAPELPDSTDQQSLWQLTPWRSSWAEGEQCLSLGMAAALAAAAGLTAAITAPIAAAAAPDPAPAATLGAPGQVPVSETAVHPLEANPITNEHTAKMTLARNAAMEHYANGRYRQAEAKFLEAVEEARLGFPPADPHIPTAQNMLAEFYRNTGQYDKAEALYLEALAQLEAIYSERHWLFASALHNLALCYEASGQLDAAGDAMERVSALRRAMFGPRHFLYADSMFALGAILLKLAAQETAKETAQQPQPQAGDTPASSWWGWVSGIGSSASSREKRAAELEARGLGLMADAVQLLEEAEHVQLNQVVGWLSELGSQYATRGRAQDWLRCARKALHHFTSDKGDQQARASHHSDALVEAALAAGDVASARDAAAQCAAARQELFGKELVVALAWLRLATIEMQLPAQLADVQAARRHAHSAATLATELLAEYSTASARNWIGKSGHDKSVKRARAAHVQASALKFLADTAPPGMSQASELEAAVSTLEAGVAAAEAQIKKLGASPEAGAVIDALAGLLVEQQLLLLDCYEALATHVGMAASQGDERAASRRAELQAKANALYQALLAQ